MIKQIIPIAILTCVSSGVFAEAKPSSEVTVEQKVKAHMEFVKAIGAEFGCSTGMTGIDVRLFLNEGTIYWNQDSNSSIGAGVAQYDMERAANEIALGENEYYKESFTFIGRGFGNGTELSFSSQTLNAKKGTVQGYFKGQLVECEVKVY
ncbi:hypothetical protein [Vibrio coralliirubri]|uniref:hypothetical protein n=1 Tax=Vibrio coralliirubri TaxID=1516159 RepID=UPI000EFB64FE|nr:hypothetical protein [Vibrio coralliirubri]